MPDRIQLVGGPLDGHEITRCSGAQLWVTGKTQRVLGLVTNDGDARALPGHRPRAYVGAGARSTPRNGAALYGPDGLYLGHKRTLCPRCGAYHAKAEGGRERPPCTLGGPDG